MWVPSDFSSSQEDLNRARALGIAHIEQDASGEYCTIGVSDRNWKKKLTIREMLKIVPEEIIYDAVIENPYLGLSWLNLTCPWKVLPSPLNFRFSENYFYDKIRAIVEKALPQHTIPHNLPYPRSAKDSPKSSQKINKQNDVTGKFKNITVNYKVPRHDKDQQIAKKRRIKNLKKTVEAIEILEKKAAKKILEKRISEVPASNLHIAAPISQTPNSDSGRLIPSSKHREKVDYPVLPNTTPTSNPPNSGKLDDGATADGAKLIVNYLPQIMTDNELYVMFITCGPLVSAEIVRDKSSGYSFGYGFVEYQNSADAAKAIKQLDGLSISNKKIKVSYSRPRRVETTNLYIGNLPEGMSDDGLVNLFTPFGTIISSNILKDQSGRNRGYAFVRYNKKSEADSAVSKLSGYTIPGSSSPLEVKAANDQGQAYTCRKGKKKQKAFYPDSSMGQH